jgi:hypothetical protein
VVYLGHGEMFAREGWAIDWFAMKHPDNPPAPMKPILPI